MRIRTMNFITKILEKTVDDSVHYQFQKFSKGIFPHRAIIQARATKEKFTISTSYEFARDLVFEVARKLGKKKTLVTGALITTLDLSKEFSFDSVKNVLGVRKHSVKKEMSGEEIIGLLEKFPKAFFAITFSDGADTTLKIKEKAPKSGKPGTKGEDIPKADFCKLSTKDHSLVRSLVFEQDTFKKASITHSFVISEIEIPKGETDFARARELAIRKGTIERLAEIDGKKVETKISLQA